MIAVTILMACFSIVEPIYVSSDGLTAFLDEVPRGDPALKYDGNDMVELLHGDDVVATARLVGGDDNVLIMSYELPKGYIHQHLGMRAVAPPDPPPALSVGAFAALAGLVKTAAMNGRYVAILAPGLDAGTGRWACRVPGGSKGVAVKSANLVLLAGIDEQVARFLHENDVAASRVDDGVLRALLAIAQWEDVATSSLFNEQAKESFANSLGKVRAGLVEPTLGCRGWTTQGLTTALFLPQADTPIYGHPFDAAPDACLDFRIYADGRAEMGTAMGSMRGSILNHNHT